MADTARAYYLQLYFDVWDDPLVAKLRATWKVALMAMLIRAVKSEEPGAILLSISALAVALNMREATCEAMLDELEERRLIGFRKGDNAIIIAHRLLPQLQGGADIGENTPLRQKTLQQREAAAERQRRSRARKNGYRGQSEAHNDVAEDKEAQPEVSEAQSRFFADIPAPSVTEALVTPVTETVVTANEQPNRVKEHYNTLPEARDTACDKPQTDSECVVSEVSEYLEIECHVLAKDAAKAAAWMSLEEARVYAFWARDIRQKHPKEGGSLGGLLASLLRDKKPVPPEYRQAWAQEQQENARQKAAAEKARKMQETQEAEADAHKIRLFNLELFLQDLPGDARARFEAAALKRLRQTNRVASEALVKNAQDARYVSLLQTAQLAEKDAWLSDAEAATQTLAS